MGLFSLRGAAPGAVRASTLVTALAAAVCLAAPPIQARSPSCDKAERYTLKNGLEVVLSPDHGLPSVALVSSVHAGFRNDPPGYEGLAHYVEHLTFRDAPPFTPVFDLYDQAGATEVNAETQTDTTNYLAVVPPVQLERALWIEARRLGLGLDALMAGPAEEERKVVLREHAMRFGQGPALAAYAATFDALFPPGHPYHEVRVPTERSTGALTLDDARWFFARYYRPDRVRLVLAGDFSPESTKPLIEKYFGALAPRTPSSDDAAAECRRSAPVPIPGAAPTAGLGRVAVTTLSRTQAVAFLWPTVDTEDSEHWRGLLTLLARRVGDAAREQGLSSGTQLELARGEFGDYWRLVLDLIPGQSFEKAEPLVQATFAEMKREPHDANEVVAERQSLELGVADSEHYLLARAQNLARRECQASRCVAAAEQTAKETLAAIDHIDPKKALIVEYHYSPGVSIDGKVERLP
jgi:zinc protease